jgi:hypothetical protein
VLARHARRVNTLTDRPPSEPIRRADYPATTAVKDVRVDHRGGYLLVPEEFLDRANALLHAALLRVLGLLEQIGGEAVAQRVGSDGLRNPSMPRGGVNGLLQHRFVNVVPLRFAEPRVAADL